MRVLEMKNTVMEIKNMFDRFISRLDRAKLYGFARVC